MRFLRNVVVLGTISWVYGILQEIELLEKPFDLIKSAFSLRSRSARTQDKKKESLTEALKNKCVPNRMFLAQFSAPYSTCRGTAKEGLGKKHPDQNKDTGQLLKSYRYKYKDYNVTTKDGYILRVYRIYGSPNYHDAPNKTKQAVYIQHGLFCASDCWNFQPGDRNLPFKLADLGYEVWLGNARGTDYSLRHKKYDANSDLPYWDFTWHEMGIYDLPAVIDKILAVTGNEKIFYVGHSMGTTMYFVMLSELQDMNDKIHAGFMLSPVAYMGHTSHSGRAGFPLVNTERRYQITNILFGGRIRNTQQFRRDFKISMGDACDLTAAKCGMCDNLIFQLMGYNAQQINHTELPNIVAKVIHTVSVKTLAHFAQTATACQFKKYDYGPVKNIHKYGSHRAPEYKLENIVAPTYFYYGEMDNMGPPNDVKLTATKFQKSTLKLVHKVTEPLWNHADFILGIDADKYVYSLVANEILRIEQELDKM